MCAPDDEDPSDEAKKRREERERFAVAVLAFCLRYDEHFREHFWKTICRVRGEDPEEMPEITNEGIHIEPPEWADLSLTSESRTHRYMWVVEAKAGAPLKPKQNPAMPDAFEKPKSGYGALFADAEAKHKTKMRYIVLGANDRLRIRDGQKRLGISVQQRSWADLIKGLKPKGVVKDLVYTFAELRIGEFYMQKAKAIVVTGGIQDAVKAATVLDAICEHYGIQKTKRDLQSDNFEEGNGCFGYYVNQPPKKASEKYRKLQRATRLSGCIAWFGYEYDETGETNRVAWFYLDSAKARDVLKRKLVSDRLTAVPIRDGDELYCVHVSSPLKQSGHDFTWFESVIDCAIKK